MSQDLEEIVALASQLQIKARRLHRHYPHWAAYHMEELASNILTLAQALQRFNMWDVKEKPMEGEQLVEFCEALVLFGVLLEDDIEKSKARGQLQAMLRSRIRELIDKASEGISGKGGER